MVDDALEKLGEQVQAILKLAGIPSYSFFDGEGLSGAAVIVDTVEPGSGVIVIWETSEPLSEADHAARKRHEWGDPARNLHKELISEIMPETLIRVLKAAGLNASQGEFGVMVEGPVPDYLTPFIGS